MVPGLPLKPPKMRYPKTLCGVRFTGSPIALLLAMNGKPLQSISIFFLQGEGETTTNSQHKPATLLEKALRRIQINTHTHTHPPPSHPTPAPVFRSQSAARWRRRVAADAALHAVAGDAHGPRRRRHGPRPPRRAAEAPGRTGGRAHTAPMRANNRAHS